MERVSVPAMDKILGKSFPVLDKGFVRLVDYMGTDSSIVQAARVSYGDGTKTALEDGSLIDYLMRHKHTSPFEMCEIKLHIKLPIFIARQWIRHRTANVNELSGRYSVMPDEYFMPEPDSFRKQSKTNKQGRENGLDHDVANSISSEMTELSDGMFQFYKNLISNHNLTREISRIVLPLSTYTEFYWKIDLHNLLHFLRLRIDKGAQKEIRDYAEIILNEMVRHWVPLTYKSFMNHSINGCSLSENQVNHLKTIINKNAIQAFIQSKQSLQGEMRELADLMKNWISE